MTRARGWNFGAGPAVLPVPVLEEAREALLAFRDTGTGILELSHRSAEFIDVREQAEAGLRRLAGADAGWAVLFLQGGASLQFHQVPLNLGADADYVITGHWSQKALEEAQRLGAPRVAATSAPAHDRVPDALDLRPGAAYVHYTSNNTIYGTQWRRAPEVSTAPLVVDASSDIFSRPLELSRHALVYAGAQKNLGPAGVTVVFIRKELLARSGKDLPPMLDYAVQAKHDSSYNTCPTFAIYVLGLVVRWLEAQGGLLAVGARNARKAARLYAALDAAPHLYRGHARPEARSQMNVTFRLPSEALEAELVREAERAGFMGLKGHRLVGGLRASLYNAMPEEGVEALAAFLADFARRA